MCQVLGVSKSGYYDWSRRVPSVSSKHRQDLDRAIEKIFWGSRNNYGSPRVHKALLGLGFAVSEDTVARRMRSMGLKSKIVKKFRVKTTDSNHPHRIAPNLLEQKFDNYAPGEVLLGDITYIDTHEGWLYLAGVLDLSSRKLAGWSMSENMKSNLVIDALKMALKTVKLGPGSIFHSDRGVQYACDAYRQLLIDNKLIASMSRRGNCYDNAVMESFFHSLKVELVHHEKFATREEAKTKIFEWIEIFYNRQRLHSSLGYKTPVAFAEEFMAQAA